MNQIATIQRPGALLTLPAVSDVLAAALVACVPTVHPASPGQDAGHYSPGTPPSPRQKREAVELLDAMRAAPRVSGAKLSAWLKAALVLPNAPSEAGLPGYAAVAALALLDMPEAALTQRALGVGLAKWRFWPSPAEVKTVLDEAAAEWRGRERALAAIVARRDAPAVDDWHSPTDEEREAVKRTAAQFRADMMAEKEEEARRNPRATIKPAHLSRETLNFIYARDGLPAPQVPQPEGVSQ